jgi:DNA (cytosine-5)-methyltransferase 1
VRPLLLDLFCCEGGAAAGYHRAGFDVIGVDIEPQPNYPYPSVQADALNAPFDLRCFDAIHASPPCQAYSVATADHSRHPDLVDPVRKMLVESGLPYVIENVPGAPLRSPVTLCGSSFSLTVRRHRSFESNIMLLVPQCLHRTQGRTLGVYGHIDGPNAARGSKHGDKARTVSEAQEAMGMPWASWHGCTQAIPPAYTEHIGRQLLAHLEAQVAA